LPGNSNSRGMRTAWFLPFLKSFTCCPLIIKRRLVGIGLSICQMTGIVQSRLELDYESDLGQVGQELPEKSSKVVPLGQPI
jgi:hypothetical protein